MKFYFDAKICSADISLASGTDLADKQSAKAVNLKF